ncbi:MAG: TlpA family protein disulfide reductase [Sandaracinaceae bacterium]|nr:TlpA family protein disulfide reductase [Sandaracinaceae bacterium]
MTQPETPSPETTPPDDARARARDTVEQLADAVEDAKAAGREMREAARPEEPPSRAIWHAVGAAALAFTLVMSFTSDLCAVSSSPLVGHEALSFTSPIVGGEGAAEGDRVVLDALRGRVVVLDFWASWCPPCRASIPALEAFARAHPEVTVLGVNVESERRDEFVRTAHEELGASYPTVHDADGRLQASYEVSALPTLLVIDVDGRVRDAHVGAVDRAWLEAHARSN